MPSFHKSTFVIAVLILASACIRLWGINHQIYTDENKVVSPSVQLAKGQQKPLLYPKGSYYPHLYHYVLGILFLPSAIADAPYPAEGTEVDTYTLLARILTAFIGTATVYVTYLIGVAIQGKKLGLLAAAIFAFLPLHVKYSHYTHVDIPLTFTVALTLWSAIHVWKTGRMKWYVITGILTGVSGAIHYTGFVIGIALLLAHAIYVVQNKKYTVRTIVSRSLIIGILLIPISFAVSTPYTIIKWQEAVRIYSQLSLRGAAGDLGYTRPDFIWPLTTSSPDWGLPFTLSGIFWESNPLVVAIAGIGILLAVYKRNWTLVILLGGSLVVMYIAIIGRLPLYAVKRLLPLTPLIALFAAWAIHEVRHGIAFVVMAIIVVQNMSHDAGFDAAYAGGSTHSMAVAWALQNIPHGSVILQHTPIRLLDASTKDYKIERLNEVYANFNAADPEASHDRATPVATWVTEKHIQYIAMDSRIVDRYFDPTSTVLFPETTASYRAFYTDIRTRGELVYRIDPKLWHLAGPRVEIYDVRNIR